MTIEIKCSASLNLFEPNDELLLPPPARRASDPVPAALTVFCHVVQDMASSRLACLHHAYDMVGRELSAHDLRIFAIHSLWQSDTKLVRYKKLWRSFRVSDDLPEERTAEDILQSSEGVKFYAMARVRRDELAKAMGVLAEEPGSLLLSTPSGQSPPSGEFVAAGWGRDAPYRLEYWREMALVAMRHESILWRPFGAFDDPEVGFNLITTPALVRRIAPAGLDLSHHTTT